MPRLSLLVILLATPAAFAQPRPLDGLIPKVAHPIKMDGKLDDWEGAFITPVHVGHPDFANRGGQFLFLWDDDNLYIGLRCLDQKPAHVAGDDQLFNGDAVEFYLDTRRGKELGSAPFGPGTLHMFYTPFTKTEVKPRLAVRNLPAFKDLKLKGAEVAGEKTKWGYTAEFRLPWANFPGFKPASGEDIGIECELCSSDGGLRVDRTFTYSSPASVGSPSAFGRVKLVEKLDDVTPFGRALLPLALNRSTNYPWLFGTVCVSPTIEKTVTKLEGKLVDRAGKTHKATTGAKRMTDGGGFVIWNASWELWDLSPGLYQLQLTATDKSGRVVTSRSVDIVHEKAK